MARGEVKLSWEKKVEVWDRRAKGESIEKVAQRVGLSEYQVKKVDKEIRMLGDSSLQQLEDKGHILTHYHPDYLEKKASQRDLLLGEQPPGKLKGQVIGHSRESLEKGAKVFIPPAYSVSIPLSIEAGEVITHIELSSVKGWPLDNYVDCSVSTADGREVVNAGRVLNCETTPNLPAGKYYLVLGNEFTTVEKRVLVTVKWEPGTGTELKGNPPEISQYSNLRADFH